MNTIFNYIHDFFYPPYCPSCGRAVTIGTFWCARCFTDVYDPREVQLENNSCITHCYVLGDYTKGLRKVIQDLKFNNKKGSIRGILPFLLAFDKELCNKNIHNAVTDEDFFWNQVDCVVPIPINKEKRLVRGYNQVDLIYNDWIRQKNIPWCDVLLKIGHTKPMWQLDKNTRKQNIKGAFITKKTQNEKASIIGKNILLVDDVLTTGATLETASQALMEGGAKKIKALTIAGGAL